MAKSTAERMADLRQRRERAGLVQVNVWVPKGDERAVREFARSLVDVRGSDKKLALEPRPAERAQNTPSPPSKANQRPSGRATERVYPTVFIDFPKKPSMDLRQRLKGAGLVFAGSPDGVCSHWKGTQVAASRFDPLVRGIETERGLILEPPFFTG